MTFITIMLVALAVSAIGFTRFIWFISVGYGYAVAAIGLALLIIFGARGELTAVGAVLASLLIAYGLRLGSYVLVRELHSESYREVKQRAIDDGAQVKLPVRVLVWLAVALLYTCQTSPVLFRLDNATANNAIGIVGCALAAMGILIESLADFTKNRFKQQHPDRFCDVGLFRIVRCPNYFGEILMWTGIFVSGIGSYANAWQWVAATAGYLCIVWIMFGGARRLELRQREHYGNDPAYQHYAATTPIILPFVPLYSVAQYRWLVG